MSRRSEGRGEGRMQKPERSREKRIQHEDTKNIMVEQYDVG